MYIYIYTDLKDLVVGDDPVIAFGDEGLQDGGGYLAVVIRAEDLPDIMEKTTDHGLLISFVTVGPVEQKREKKEKFFAVRYKIKQYLINLFKLQAAVHIYL